uniref:16S rRNA (cytosine(1402)-N(4))-methyltransferase RsmH n=1 Tax=Candidatus Neptunichlamydia sp. REUL1 TaxID=3064277 RepID=UPI00292F1B5A|nr:16S rRNA (cytosine(1402)-N(4))-methyltransferase RsmH [Candidatus Neptunochlamydia sp. REUL1]
MQLDEEKRGFSFLREGPLDMRMDPSTGITAKEIVNKWSEKDLANLFREYGEERRWRQAARAIVEARRKKTIETTTELAEILSQSIGRSKKKLHPATLVFQALRISVNRELDSIEEGVKSAIQTLAPGGRIGVLAFHRLEDRIVKNLFRTASKPIKKMIEMKETHIYPMLKLLTKKPLIPTFQESRTNRRARSAKLRVAERI